MNGRSRRCPNPATRGRQADDHQFESPPLHQEVGANLDPNVMKTLSAYAARREQPLSLIAEAAIASFLSPDADERREAATAKRLDQIDRRIARIERPRLRSPVSAARVVCGSQPVITISSAMLAPRSC
jgi:predicted transcriptional regulator